MDAVYNPPNEISLRDWFEQIGEATGNEQCWATLRHSVVQVTAASNVFLLKKVRDADMDMAIANAKLSVGYKDTLCDYLTPSVQSTHACCLPAYPSPLRARAALPRQRLRLPLIASLRAE